MANRDVVITGLGLVTPLGAGVETNWARLTAGQSGLRRITGFETADLPAKVAGIVPDIADDPDLEARYGRRIPVLMADDEFVCSYRLDLERVRGYLRQGG